MRTSATRPPRGGRPRAPRRDDGAGSREAAPRRTSVHAFCAGSRIAREEPFVRGGRVLPAAGGLEHDRELLDGAGVGLVERRGAHEAVRSASMVADALGVDVAGTLVVLARDAGSAVRSACAAMTRAYSSHERRRRRIASSVACAPAFVWSASSARWSDASAPSTSPR